MAGGTTQAEGCVLVTGADGFVGGWLVRELAAKLPEPVRIVATVRRPRAGAGPLSGRVDHVGLDVTDPEAARAVVREARPSVVVHLAAVSSVPEAQADARRTWDVNLNGTLNLAEAVRDGTDGARFMFVGTSEVYGDTFKTATAALDEGALLAPANTYAASKAAADLLVGSMAGHGLNAVRLRPFNHTGPGQSESFVVSAFAAQIARIEAGRQPPTLRVGNLDAFRDFLDVRDVVDAYLRVVLADDLPSGTILNLASGRPKRIGDILDRLLGQARCAIEVQQDQARMRPSDVPIAIGSASRAREMLGWSQRIPFEQTLADVLGSWRTSVAGA